MRPARPPTKEEKWDLSLLELAADAILEYEVLLFESFHRGLGNYMHKELLP